MDSLFIQFCQIIVKQRTTASTFLQKGSKFHLLANGFSYVWDYANPVWVELDQKLNVVTPIDFSNYQVVYVSVSFFEHIFIVLDWARENPQISFIMGGPAITALPALQWEMYKIPSNVTGLDSLAESIFGLPLDPKRFKLVPPDPTISKLYNFHIENGCYWGGCKFCIYPKHYQGGDMGFDLEALWNAPPGGVWLGTSSISPKNCRIFTELNYTDKRYHCYVRGDSLILDALPKVLSNVKQPSSLRFLVGVEFPSNRMLKIMNKCTDIDTLARVINILIDAKCKVSLTFMTGWGCLEENDIKEAEKFFKMLPDGSKFDSGYARLQNWNRNIPFVANEPTPLGGYPFFVRLTKEQEQLDNQWKNILHGCNRALSDESNVGSYFIMHRRVEENLLKLKEFTEEFSMKKMRDDISQVKKEFEEEGELKSRLEK